MYKYLIDYAINSTSGEGVHTNKFTANNTELNTSKNSRTMDSRLYSAGYLAIPLKANQGHSLNPQPNFMVIENIFGRTKAEIPTLGDVVVANSQYKLVHREILEANEELGRGETMREIIYENENQYVPIMIVPALSDYGYLKASLAQVNGMLSIFQFRGVLEGFVLEIDEEKVDEIIVDLTPVVIPPVEEPVG